MNILHSTLSTWRERLAPITHTSTFLETGQITPEEFVLAGDYLVFKFPSWNWSEASTPDRRVAYLPEKKQFLMTRGVPCNRRLDENFAGDAGREGVVVTDGFGAGGEGTSRRRSSGDDDDGWMNTGPMTDSHQERIKEVQAMDESGNIGETEDDDEDVPDMEEEDDEEAIIRDPSATKNKSGSARNYSLYVTYSPYYRTPRIYLSGYINHSEPLAPHLMMEDIVGDYKDKTVTLEDFPFFDSGVKMASVHPCKHAPVMRVLLDRADAALKLRMEKIRKAAARGDGKIPDNLNSGLEGLIDDTARLKVSGGDKTGHAAGVGTAGGNAGDEWEVLQHEPGEEDDRNALRVDQYLIVFLKFIASVTPGIEHDFTMGV